MGMLAASVEALKEKKVLDFFTDLSVALGKIEPTVGDCKVVGSEVKKLVGALRSLKRLQHGQKHVMPRTTRQLVSSSAKSSERSWKRMAQPWFELKSDSRFSVRFFVN